MNTGIGDAMNLAWKLAAVLARQRRAHPRLVRGRAHPVRASLVATTDRVFELVDERIEDREPRLHAMPALIGRLFRLGAVRELAFRTVSQLEIRYRDSPLSVGRAGKIRGGDRLPWTGMNFEPLRALAWQVHIYGEAPDSARAACDALRLPLHAMPWEDAAETAGLERDAAHLVRPDGYVALALPAQRSAPKALEAYFTERGLKAARRS